jgi:hypothetical protein
MKVKISPNISANVRSWNPKHLEGNGVKIELDNGSILLGRSFDNSENETYFEIKDMAGSKVEIPRKRIISVCKEYSYCLLLDNEVAMMSLLVPKHIIVTNVCPIEGLLPSDLGIKEELLTRYSPINAV